MTVRTFRATCALAAATAVTALLAGCGSSEPPALPLDTVSFGDSPAATAEPGQQLSEGDIVTLPLPKNDDTIVPIETVVVGSAAGTQKFWSTFDNGSQFEGETPYFVVVQNRWVEGSPTASSAPLLKPVLDDGSEGSVIQLDSVIGGTDQACPFDLPELDDFEHEMIRCVVMSAPEGRTLTGVRWDSTSKFTIYEPDPAEQPFYGSPVVWSTTPLQPKTD